MDDPLKDPAILARLRQHIMSHPKLPEVDYTKKDFTGIAKILGFGTMKVTDESPEDKMERYKEELKKTFEQKFDPREICASNSFTTVMDPQSTINIIHLE